MSFKSENWRDRLKLVAFVAEPFRLVLSGDSVLAGGCAALRP